MSKPDNITEPQKLKYYNLLKKINVTQLQYYKGSAKFNVWAVGWAGDADYKYYEYKPIKIKNLVNSLDNLPLNQKDRAFYHRTINDNWYLAFDHWP